MILSLVAVWFRVNVCGADETKPSISEFPAKGENDPPLEVLLEPNTKTTQDETTPEKLQLQNSKSEIFEDYILPVVLIPLLPVSIGAQIVCLFVVKDFSRCVGH
jgi:hypothetical protein